MTSAASTIAIAEATASRRSRSTSTRRAEAPITSAGRATRPASHSRASLILIASVDSGGQPGGSTASHSHWSRRVSRPASLVNGSTTTRSRMLSRNPRSSAIRNSCRRARSDRTTEVAAVRDGVIADGVLESVQVVEDVRRTQELQQAKARVSGQVDERECMPANGNFRDDDPHLRERGIRQRRLHVALDARRRSRKQCRAAPRPPARSRAAGACSSSGAARSSRKQPA